MDAGQIVVTQVQKAKLAAEEKLAGDFLNLIPVQIKPLQVGKSTNLHGYVSDLVVPEFEADQPMQVLEADDLLYCLQVVVLQVNLLQVVQTEDGVWDAFKVTANKLKLCQVDHFL